MRELVLDMDSSVSETYGEQEGTAYNGHFACTCYHPLFCFNQFGDVEGALLREGNVHSAKDWRAVLEPVVARYPARKLRRYFRADAAFAQPELYEYLEAEGFEYAIRLPANDVLLREIEPMLTRPVGRPSNTPVVRYAGFLYQAKSWNRSRRVVAKVEWHRGELFPRIGFIVTNLTRPGQNEWCGFTTSGERRSNGSRKARMRSNGRGCRAMISWTIRCGCTCSCWPTTWATFCGRRCCRGSVRHWTLTTLREKLIKIGAKVVRHSRKIVFPDGRGGGSASVVPVHSSGNRPLAPARQGQRMNEN